MRPVSLTAGAIVAQRSTGRRMPAPDRCSGRGGGGALHFAHLGSIDRMTPLMSGLVDSFNRDGFLVVPRCHPGSGSGRIHRGAGGGGGPARRGDVRARRDIPSLRRRAVRHALVPHLGRARRGAEAGHLACLRVRTRAVRAVDPRGDSGRGGAGGGRGDSGQRRLHPASQAAVAEPAAVAPGLRVHARHRAVPLADGVGAVRAGERRQRRHAVHPRLAPAADPGAPTRAKARATQRRRATRRRGAQW